MSKDFEREPRALLTRLYHAAVQRALPAAQLRHHLPPVPRGRTVVVGAGKAAGAMAHALEAAWPAEAPLAGVVVTRYGHTPPRPAVGERTLQGSLCVPKLRIATRAITSRRRAMAYAGPQNAVARE